MDKNYNPELTRIGHALWIFLLFLIALSLWLHFYFPPDDKSYVAKKWSKQAAAVAMHMTCENSVCTINK